MNLRPIPQAVQATFPPAFVYPPLPALFDDDTLAPTRPPDWPGPDAVWFIGQGGRVMVSDAADTVAVTYNMDDTVDWMLFGPSALSAASLAWWHENRRMRRR